MQTEKQLLEKTIEHTFIGGFHSIIIHDLKNGKHLRYPVTTESDALYVSQFLRNVLLNTASQLFAFVAVAAAAKSSEESVEVPPSVTGPSDLNNPGLPLDSSAGEEAEASEEDDLDSNLEQMG